jgi:putative transposase
MHKAPGAPANHDRAIVRGLGNDRMPRQRRLHVSGGLYHAVLRGNHRQAIFAGSDDYLCFEDIVARALERYGATLHAYCWMTNHVHLAIGIADAPLGSVMGIVASRYARAKQRAIPTTGHLFERRYRARLVDADRYLLALVRYVHLNPVRARMVADPSDYRWSSHRAYLGASCPDWLRIEPVLGRLGSSAEAARAAYRQLMNETPAAAEREELSPTVRVGRWTRAGISSPRAKPCVARVVVNSPRSLKAIAVEVAQEHDVTMEDLLSKRRRPHLVQARGEVARRALLEGVANLSQVARYLNRAPSTISGLLHGRR